MAAQCSLLDNPAARDKMGGMFETKLLLACGRSAELGGVTAPTSPAMADAINGVDVLVNDPTGESGATTTQSETTIAVNENTGTICSGYNDAYSGVVQGLGYTGFSRSTDGGATFVDGGALGSRSFGDPSLVWRRADGYFYFGALDQSGLGIWRSTDDCATFQFYALMHSGGGDDKELIAVDNNPASPHYGRIYNAWTDFNAGARIFVNYSDDGLTWSTPVGVSAVGVDVQGAWPTVAPNGDVYVGWVRWNPYFSGPIDIEIVRSTNGGATFSLVTNPMSGEVNPRAATPTSSCGRPALNGNIRYLPSPQLAVTPNGDLHVVYSYDPDGYNTGDVVNVYYRRSSDNGATWGPEVQLNDDGTTRDQYQPTLSVGTSGRVMTGWYDRREDAGNLLFRYYARVSEDGGTTWSASEAIADVQSPVYLDPNLATCYHGDYDTQIQTPAFGYLQWSDDRNVVSGHQDPDVWFDQKPFSPDFTLTATPASQDICAPDSALYMVDVGSILGYSDPVTLSASGVPSGYDASFSTNPVIPPGMSDMTLTNSGASLAGSYNIDVVGVAPTSTHTTTVQLNLFTATPDAPTLLAPADGATGVVLVPTFSWSAVDQAAEYHLQLYGDGPTLIYEVFTADTSHTIDIALDPLTPYSWRVAAINPCDHGPWSDFFSFTTQDIPPILLVDDDDNSPDVRAYYTDALDALGQVYDIWDTANSDNEPSYTDLLPYNMVIWFTGDEFGGAAGPGSAGEAALGQWLDEGQCLFLSSQDYHYDRGLTAFMQEYLGVQSATDDNGDYTSVTGQGLVFGGLGPYGLTYPFTDYSDVVTGDGTGENAWRGDNNNTAGLDKDSGVYRTTFWVYPWEAISTAADREESMATAISWCGTGVATGTLEGTVTDGDSGLGIGGATVTADDGGGLPRSTTTNPNGDYIFTLAVGTYDVTASAENYQPELVSNIEIVTDTVTTQDFELFGSQLLYSPASIEVMMDIGDVVTTPVTLAATGPLPIDWSASIGNYGGPGVLSIRRTGVSVPRFEGQLPADSRPLSMERAPDARALGVPLASAPLSQILGESAYGLDVFPGSNLVNFPDADVPGTWNIIGSVPQFHPAADFLNGDFSTLYALDYDTNEFVTIDTATGARTVIGVTSPSGNWSGMTGAVDGTLYAASSVCGTSSTLYTVNPATGALTTVGQVGAGTCIIDIAINAAGEMYGVDIVSDNLYQIDPTTGAGTVVGPLGASANFAQGMDFEETSGILYWAAYTTAGEMRIIDTATGASTLIGAFPGGAEVDGLAFATGGGGAGNWASAVPDSGTVPANSTATFDVVFDARSLFEVGDYTAELSFSGTFVNEPPVMPLTMHLECPTCGFLEGSITDWLTGDPLSADIHITGPGGFDVNLTGDSYAIAVQPGNYDFEVSADGYLPEAATVVATQGATTITDFALVPAISILEYAPPEIEEFMDLGDVVTTPVTIHNSGYITMNFSLSFSNFGSPGLNAPVNLPASDGQFARGAAAPSLGMAPATKVDQGAPTGGILAPDSPAFGVDFFSAQLWTFTLDNASNPTPVGAAPRSYYAGDFVTGSWDTLYAVDQDTLTLYAIDTATAASVAIGPMPASGGQSWTGMSWDTAAGVMYALSTDCSNNTLYTVDLATGAPTTVGTTAGVCIIDIAVSADGVMYGVDILGDQLGTVNKATGAWSPIGSIGFDANFAQGMDFDEETNTLYLAAYNNALGAAELRIADVNTGNTALVSPLGPGLGAEVDSFGIVAGSAGFTDWVSAVPDSGSVPPGGSTTIDVVFDARSLTFLGDYTAQMNFSGGFANDPPPMPLTMHVSCPTCGILAGSITGSFGGQPVDADINILGEGGFEVTVSGSSYEVIVPAGLYEITVTADGFFGQQATVEALVGQTVVTDFVLVPQVARLRYGPPLVEATVFLGDAMRTQMKFGNAGTIPFDFSVQDVEVGREVAVETICPPDAFGYSCTDSNEGGVDYAFEDISATGTPITLGDDQVSAALPLGFDFDFYGTVYGSAYVSSNGFVSLVQTTNSGCCTGQQLPNPSTPNGLVAGWWEDLDPPEGGAIYYQMMGSAPTRYFIVQFTDIQHFPSGNAVTFQYKLFEGSNNIEVHYDTLATDGGSHSIGIENESGTVGLSYLSGGAPPPATPLAVCFLYPGQSTCGSGASDALWATEDPTGGTVLPGSFQRVLVTFDAADPAVISQTGTYTASLLIDGTFTNPVDPATFVMHVVPPGQVSIDLLTTLSTDGSCGTAKYVSVPAGTAVTYCFTVTNTGDNTLSAHRILNSTFGVVYSFYYPLQPGETKSVTYTRTIGQTTLSASRWRALTSTTQAMDADITLVVVQPPLAPEAASPAPAAKPSYDLWLDSWLSD